jgi:hypothetical protein
MRSPAALRRRLDYVGPAIFSYGFRPFFLGGASEDLHRASLRSSSGTSWISWIAGLLQAPRAFVWEGTPA